MKAVYFISIMAFVVAFVSCSVEGPVGPAGPAGPTGATGNSKVTNQVITVDASGWSVNSSYSWEIDVSGTDSLVQSGSVECYYSTNDSTWIALPWIFNSTGPLYEQECSFNGTNSTWSISWFNITNELSAPTPPALCYFNFVAIPISLMKKYPGVNWNDASQVMKSLPEVQAAINNAKNK